MPISFQISEKYDVLCATWVGEIGSELVYKNFDNYLQHESFKLGRLELLDLSRMTTLLSSDEMQSLAWNLKNGVPGYDEVRTLIWALSDRTYGMARLYQTHTEFLNGPKIEVYRHEADLFGAVDLPFTSFDELRAEPSMCAPVTTSG